MRPFVIPAVIDDDVVPAVRQQLLLHVSRVGHHLVFGDAVTEGVEAVPAHGRKRGLGKATMRDDKEYDQDEGNDSHDELPKKRPADWRVIVSTFWMMKRDQSVRRLPAKHPANATSASEVGSGMTSRFMLSKKTSVLPFDR